MAAARLPDDPKDWPEDPYDLLKVARSVDRRGLRIAYTDLIRIYKPERFPEQFRRIREAYEAISNFIQWREDARSQGYELAEDGSVTSEPDYTLVSE